MNRKVVIIDEDSIRSLEGGLDIKELGHAQIKRVSEIEWREDVQKWAVNIRRHGLLTDAHNRVILFQRYNEAVNHEQRWLNRHPEFMR